jgi:hypothetical protein
MVVRELDKVFASFGQKPAANDELLRRAIAEVDYEAVNKNCIACQPQLDGAKKTIPARDFDPATISIPIDLSATQEIPSLPTGAQRSGGH